MSEEEMRQRVRTALRYAQEDGTRAITVRSIANSAGVYRSFITRRPDLLREIQAAKPAMREEDKRTILVWFKASRRVVDLIGEAQGDGTASQFIWDAVLEKLARAQAVSVGDIDPVRRVRMKPNRRNCIEG